MVYKMKIFAFRFRFDILNSLLQSYEKMENSSKHFTYYVYANVYVICLDIETNFWLMFCMIKGKPTIVDLPILVLTLI